MHPTSSRAACLVLACTGFILFSVSIGLKDLFRSEHATYTGISLLSFKNRHHYGLFGVCVSMVDEYSDIPLICYRYHAFDGVHKSAVALGISAAMSGGISALLLVANLVTKKKQFLKVSMGFTAAFVVLAAGCLITFRFVVHGFEDKRGDNMDEWWSSLGSGSYVGATAIQVAVVALAMHVYAMIQARGQQCDEHVVLVAEPASYA